jgi:hypothetical protein
MHEFKAFSGDGPLERAAHLPEKRVRHEVGTDQVFQVGVVVADHIHRIHPGKSFNKRHLLNENPADIGLPEFKQIAQHKKFAAAGFDIIQKKSEFSGLIVGGKVVPRTAVTDMQVAYNKNVFLSRQSKISFSFKIEWSLSYPFVPSV